MKRHRRYQAKLANPVVSSIAKIVDAPIAHQGDKRLSISAVSHARDVAVMISISRGPQAGGHFTNLPFCGPEVQRHLPLASFAMPIPADVVDVGHFANFPLASRQAGAASAGAVSSATAAKASISFMVGSPVDSTGRIVLVDDDEGKR